MEIRGKIGISQIWSTFFALKFFLRLNYKKEYSLNLFILNNIFIQ